MKKFQKALLALLFPLSLSYQSTHPQAEWNNLIHKAYMAFTENSWYCIKSDAALIAQAEAGYFAVYSHYKPTIDYFLISQAGLIAKYGQSREKIFIDSLKINGIGESILHDFALYIENKKESLLSYGRQIDLAREKLAQRQEDLTRRIHIRSAQRGSYEQQKNVHRMRTLLKDISILSHYLTILNQCFEAHKEYFSFHQIMEDLINRYTPYLILLKPHELMENIRDCVFNGTKIKHSLIMFVKHLVIDIDTLQKESTNLSHNTYDGAQKDAAQLLNQLIGIKNNLVSNDIYWQELAQYQTEVERRIKELERKLRKERMRPPQMIYQMVYYPVPVYNPAWTRMY